MPENLKYVKLDSFLGLSQRPFPPFGSASQMSGCYPLPQSQGLYPAHAVTALPNTPGATDTAAVGLFSDGPIASAAYNATVADLWACCGDSAAPDTAHYYRLHGNPGNASQYDAAWQDYLDHTDAGNGPPTRVDFWPYRDSLATSVQPILIAVNEHRQTSGVGYLYFFPDPGSPATDSNLLWLTSHAEDMVQFSQRLFWAEVYANSHTASGSEFDANTFAFTDPGANSIAATSPTILSGTDQGRPAFIVPVDVSDLLIMKETGAYMLQGDPAATRLVRLPNVVPGTQQFVSQTPWGLAYGATDGPVCLYNGGGSQSISPGMNPGFWQNVVGQVAGGFDWAGDHLFCPNGFCWDSRTSAWWQHPGLAAAALFTDYRGIGNSRLIFSTTAKNYGEILAVTDTSPRVSTWTWTSWPLLRPTHRPVEVREVQLVVQSMTPGDQITVTCSLPDQRGSTETHAVTLHADSPELIRFNFSTEAAAITPTVTIAASSGSNQAGMLDELQIGYRDRVQAPSSS